MLPAETRNDKPFLPTRTREVAIRTLGVSLVAIAAVVATLAIARQRGEQRSFGPRTAPDDHTLTLDLNLEAIRAAGF